MELTRNLHFEHLIFKCDLYVGVATQLLRVSHRLIMVISGAKFF
jgi:hypothetical protein